MFISNPVTAFALSEDQAKAFAEKLFRAAQKRENSWKDEQYTIDLFEAAERDQNVYLALRMSWNESLDFAKAYGFSFP